MNYIEKLEELILEDLSKLEKNYGSRKWAISKRTNIPIDVLTVLLKRLKDNGYIELIMIFSESTGLADGSGYCLKGNLQKQR